MKLFWQTLRFLWKYSPLVTAPAAAVFLVWVFQTSTSFYQFGMRYGGETGRVGLYQAGESEALRLRRAFEVSVLEEAPDQEQVLEQVHLMISEGSERALNAHLPHSGRSYKDGFLLYPDGSLQEVDLRYRGDFPWHWATPKKSWRVRTSRASMWNNMRSFNLIVPKGKGIVEDALGYWLAKEMDLLAPESRVVELIMNGKSRGVHVLVEQLEELVLRKSNRMPGDIFAGELIGRDVHPGLTENVFEHPGTWSKVAINNHFDDHENAAMVALCRLLEEPASERNAQELAQLVNVEAFARFAAYRLITQTEHFDRIHNWRLYYDPWKNSFEPIVWDPVPWHTNWMPKQGQDPFLDVRFCELDDRLLQYHPYRIAQDRVMRDFFTSGLRDRLLEKYDRWVAEISDALDRDPTLQFGMRYVSAEEVRSYQTKWRDTVVQMFAKFEETHLGQPPLVSFTHEAPTESTLQLRAAIYGRSSLDGLRLEFAQPLDALPEVTVEVTANGTNHQLMLGDLALVQGRYLDLHLPMMGGLPLVRNPLSTSYADRGHLVLAPISYDFQIAASREALPDLVRATGLRDGRPSVPTTQAESLPLFPADDQYGLLPSHSSVEPLVWQGTIEWHGQKTIRDDVILMPGTEIRMAPEASIIFEGAVIAQATAEQPIRFLPLQEGQAPWGTVALRGPGADGSVLEYVEMIGGSGWKLPLAEYSSMFSIHFVQDVIVRNCLFQDSYVVDDMVHGVYASVLFEGTRFVRSLADALDMDISTVQVINCVFEDSGNDSVDLMTATAVVQGTQFLHSKDKGISIGENSTLFAQNCLFLGCEIGLQSKDESQAAVVNADIINCNWGVDAYKKNWRYNGGGEIYVYKSRLLGNQITLRADRHSIVGIADSNLSEWPEADDPSLMLGQFLGEGMTDRAGIAPGRPYRFEREKRVLAPLGTAIWASVVEERRGSSFTW